MSGAHGLLALLDDEFRPGSLNVVAALPSLGKTFLALNIARSGRFRDG